MRPSVLLLLLAAALSLSGCGSDKQILRTRPRDYHHIISLSPSTSELISQYGSSNDLIGHTAADNYPAYAAGHGEIVVTTKPDYEKIAMLKPDLVLYDSALYSDQEIDQVKKAAPQATIFAITADTVDDFVTQLYQLGSLLGGETKVSEYVDRIYGERATAGSSAPSPPPQVAVIMPGESAPDYIAGTKSFDADAVRSAGGVPVGPEANNFVMISPEALVALNPDVIIVPGNKKDLKAAEALVNNPRYKSIKALQNNRVRVIDQDVLLRRGSRVDTLIKGIAEALVPGKGH